MILPEDFPYITSIYVNDCYTYQNFNIDLIKHQPFSHLILTGKNGSGKSTILRNLNMHISYATKHRKDVKNEVVVRKRYILGDPNDSIYLNSIDRWKKELNEFEKIAPCYLNEIIPLFQYFPQI